MAESPFLHVLETTLPGNGSGTLSVLVPNSEKLTIHGFRFVSTGTFNLTGIRTTDGVHYTNASQSVEIPSTVLGDATNGYNTLKDFRVPLVVEGGAT